jgi:small GTP-binding protein
MNNIKIVAVGDGAVGKTSLLISYSTNSFPSDYVPTVFDNYSVNLMADGKVYHVDLWDTAGQEDYDKIRPISYSLTDVFIVCYSVISRTSFQNVRHKWLPELRHHQPNSPILLIGLKNDLRKGTPPEQCVAEEEAERFVKDTGLAGHYLCSALVGDGVKTLFDDAIKLTITQRNKPEAKACCTIL